jgi:chromosome partitioning protein
MLVDLDPQGNATMGCGVDKYTLNASTYDVLVDEAEIADVTVPAGEAGFDVLPANGDLTAAEVELLEFDHRERKLRSALAAIEERYDYIFIDCPPSLNMLTLNGMVAADGVIIAMQCEYYALEGVSQLMNTIGLIRNKLNPTLAIEGVLLSMFDKRTNLSVQVVEEVKEYFKDKVYKTVIPRNVRLAEAPSYGLPITEYDPKSRGAQAYQALAEEFLALEGKEEV